MLVSLCMTSISLASAITTNPPPPLALPAEHHPTPKPSISSMSTQHDLKPPVHLLPLCILSPLCSSSQRESVASNVLLFPHYQSLIDITLIEALRLHVRCGIRRRKSNSKRKEVEKEKELNKGRKMKTKKSKRRNKRGKKRMTTTKKQ